MNRHFPFDAAIFDLDGTLLDSMYIWKEIDRKFFEKRGMTVTETYSRNVKGMSFAQTARYTVDYMGLSETPEQVCAEWIDMLREEYEERVQIKPGAREYLTLLKRSGIRMAVATSNRPQLFEPCLKRLGIYDFFDTFVTCDDAGGRDKSDGGIFLLAAERLGASPDRCIVFEDLIEGITGAKRAGMTAYCIWDAASVHEHEAISQIADRMVSDYFKLCAETRCVIFTARCEGDAAAAYADRRASDYVLCADAGWRTAREMNVLIDCAIGDFDSCEPPCDVPVVRHPVMKDDPDTMLCVRYALEMGIRDFLIVGGFGGRLDHTLANLQTLRYIAQAGGRAEMRDGNLRAVAIRNGEAEIPRTDGKLSVFALSEKCAGVCIRGAKYKLEDGELSDDFPLGMGNDFAADTAHISVREGTILVIAENRRE